MSWPCGSWGHRSGTCWKPYACRQKASSGEDRPGDWVAWGPQKLLRELHLGSRVECSYEEDGEDLGGLKTIHLAYGTLFCTTSWWITWSVALESSRATRVNIFQVYTNFQVVESDFIMFPCASKWFWVSLIPPLPLIDYEHDYLEVSFSVKWSLSKRTSMSTHDKFVVKPRKHRPFSKWRVVGATVHWSWGLRAWIPTYPYFRMYQSMVVLTTHFNLYM